MATMNVSLPDPMKIWVESQTDDGTYANASDYVRDLIRRDQTRKMRIANIQKLIDEGRASGRSNSTMDEILAEAKAEYEAREAT